MEVVYLSHYEYVSVCAPENGYWIVCTCPKIYAVCKLKGKVDHVTRRLTDIRMLL
jgi:hypothetical protein